MLFPPPPGSFTALLMADDLPDHELEPDLLPPLPETLESLIPPSILNPGKRTLMDVPTSSVMPSQKLPRIELQQPSLESILNGFSLSEFAAALINIPKKKEPAPVPAKPRRQRLPEKARSLGKILPGDQKMNTATILEEAHDYIKYLQAQIQALSFMPPRSGGGSGVLGGLSRQQVLEVVVNSPAAQALLSSEKCCIVSSEQVEVLKYILQQRLSDAGI